MKKTLWAITHKKINELFVPCLLLITLVITSGVMSQQQEQQIVESIQTIERIKLKLSLIKEA